MKLCRENTTTNLSVSLDCNVELLPLNVTSIDKFILNLEVSLKISDFLEEIIKFSLLGV